MRPRHAMKVSIPDTVLSTELHDEGVLLNLETGEYYGLDAVGMDMWKALRAHGDVAATCAHVLLEQFDVDRDTLARDLDALIARLAERKLVVVDE